MKITTTGITARMVEKKGGRALTASAIPTIGEYRRMSYQKAQDRLSQRYERGLTIPLIP